MHEKTAEEVRKAELIKFAATVPKHADDTMELACDAFEAGFAAGRRGEQVEIRERILFVLLGR